MWNPGNLEPDAVAQQALGELLHSLDAAHPWPCAQVMGSDPVVQSPHRLATAIGSTSTTPTSSPAMASATTLRLQGPFGELEYLAPITRYSRTPAYWQRPPEPFGASPARW